ncbi:MAG: hypothetical protein RL681_692 [Candidatus Parcubacteria bacterium]|jgi:hypothetical protein
MKIYAAFVITILAALVQLLIGRALPAVPDIALAALLALGSGVGFLVELGLVAVSVLILNWQSGPSADLLLFIALPLIGWLAAHRMPFQPWLAGFVVVALGCAAFPFILAPDVVLNDPIRYLRLWGVGLFVGLLAASALDAADEARTK